MTFYKVHGTCKKYDVVIAKRYVQRKKNDANANTNTNANAGWERGGWEQSILVAVLPRKRKVLASLIIVRVLATTVCRIRGG